MQTPSVRLQGLFLFGCPRTSPLNIKRATSQYVSVVIVQAIMPERMESGVTIPRVQCSSVKCKMNILRREGAEMWCCFPWGSQWKVTLDLLCVLKWAYVESARDKPLSSLSDNWVFFFFFVLKELLSSLSNLFSENLFYWLETKLLSCSPWREENPGVTIKCECQWVY